MGRVVVVVPDVPLHLVQLIRCIIVKRREVQSLAGVESLLPRIPEVDLRDLPLLSNKGRVWMSPIDR